MPAGNGSLCSVVALLHSLVRSATIEGVGVAMLTCALPLALALAMRWAGLHKRRCKPGPVESDDDCAVGVAKQGFF